MHIAMMLCVRVHVKGYCSDCLYSTDGSLRIWGKRYKKKKMGTYKNHLHIERGSEQYTSEVFREIFVRQ